MKRLPLILIMIAAFGSILLYGSTARASWFLSLNGSAYQTSDSVGTGYMASLGVGYRFSPYFSEITEVGWASYIVESDDENLRVNLIPVTETVAVDLLPGQPVDPFLEGGVGIYGTKIERESWDWTFGLHGGGGLRIRLGRAMGFNIHARYVVTDMGDMDEGAWSYGLDFGVSLGG